MSIIYYYIKIVYPTTPTGDDETIGSSASSPLSVPPVAKHPIQLTKEFREMQFVKKSKLIFKLIILIFNF